MNQWKEALSEQDWFKQIKGVIPKDDCKNFIQTEIIKSLIADIPEDGVMIIEERPFAKVTTYLSDLKSDLKAKWLEGKE